MALRFQDGRDEVDRAAKESRATGVMVFLLLLLAVITGAVDWFSGESLASYEKELAFYIGLAFVTWLAAPFYHEFRIRTKEIDGKVSAIEEAVNAFAKQQSKLMHKLTAIERALDVRTDDTDENPVIQEEEADEKENVDTATREKMLATYRESANLGEAWGQHNLGITYYNGDRGARDFSQAAFWFRKAAEQGDEFSQLLVADSICAGKEVPPTDYAEALQWYQKVSEQNSMWSEHAEYSLGKIYESGKGVPKDYPEAVKWWQKAAEHGNSLAHYELGDLYATGAEGVPQNYSEAYFRLLVATDGKGLGPMQESALEKRDQLGKRLTPEALSQAQERARKWFEDHPAKLQ